MLATLCSTRVFKLLSRLLSCLGSYLVQLSHELVQAHEPSC